MPLLKQSIISKQAHRNDESDIVVRYHFLVDLRKAISYNKVKQ